MDSNYGYGMPFDRNNSMAFGHGVVFDVFRTKVLICMDQNWHLMVLSNRGDTTVSLIDPIPDSACYHAANILCKYTKFDQGTLQIKFGGETRQSLAHWADDLASDPGTAWPQCDHYGRGIRSR
jgi:hypothetical protein